LKELNAVIAANICELRKSAGMTQGELAEILSYSDKAISKWERGESVPDIAVLKQIADTFSVTVDYLLTSEHQEFKTEKKEVTKRKKLNRFLISLISIVLVWLVAIFVYMNIDLFAKNAYNWLAFMYAIPASAVVALVFNSIWGKPKINFLIISILLWSLITSIFLTLTIVTKPIWLLFVLGVPGQIIVILWSGIREIPSTKKGKKRKKDIG
jgi:transcriptional regulator with XRE-family HTH domain